MHGHRPPVFLATISWSFTTIRNGTDVDTEVSMGKSGYKSLWKSSKQNVPLIKRTANPPTGKNGPMILCTVSSPSTNKNSGGLRNTINWRSTATSSTVSNGSWNDHLSPHWRTNSVSACRRCTSDMKPSPRLLTDHGRFSRSRLRERKERNHWWHNGGAFHWHGKPKQSSMIR